MDVTVVDNFLGVCKQEGPVSIGPILSGGGAVLFNSPKRIHVNPYCSRDVQQFFFLPLNGW
jgi:hypothetical protein